MQEPIGKVFIIQRFREAGYALSPSEREAMLAQVAVARHEYGGRLLVNAAARWSAYGIYGFGVEVFPDLGALKKHTKALEKLDWYRYVEAESFIGTPLLINEPVYENPIYQLQLIQGVRAVSHSLPEGQFNDRLNQVVASADDLGIRRLLRMDCRWSRESHLLIQVHEWPSLEAQMDQVAFEEQLEWPRWFSQSHFLGVKAP
ncbi:MAG: hypothetical protein MUE67_01755 [Anaerolineales bacterium]|jgi:hypothetical protein|nr:hypothetical protein [Anaerolineales bacterium]